MPVQRSGCPRQGGPLWSPAPNRPEMRQSQGLRPLEPPWNATDPMEVRAPTLRRAAGNGCACAARVAGRRLHGRRRWCQAGRHAARLDPAASFRDRPQVCASLSSARLGLRRTHPARAPLTLGTTLSRRCLGAAPTPASGQSGATRPYIEQRWRATLRSRGCWCSARPRRTPTRRRRSCSACNRDHAAPHNTHSAHVIQHT